MPMRVRAELHQRLADFLEQGQPRGIEVGEHVAYHRDRARSYRAQLGPIDENVNV